MIDVFGPLALVCVSALATILSFVLTGLVRRWALKNAVMDLPNARSSHDVPTPRGGGLAVVLVVLPLLYAFDATPFVIILVAAALALIGLIDDVHSLPVLPRILFQVVSVAIALIWAVDAGAVLPYLTPLLSALVIGMGWVWFVNLYNFMDGIDGITTVETLSICIGVIAIGLIVPETEHLIAPAAILAAAMLGFGWWNWQPAKIFLGDVGSITLGFLCGYFLVNLAAADEIVAAVLLSGYYLADATTTLLRRALRGDKVWHSHKEHFYQKAHQRGLSHAQVSTRIFVLNLSLIGCAVAAVHGYTIWASVVGGILIILFLAHLGVRSHSRTIAS